MQDQPVSRQETAGTTGLSVAWALKDINNVNNIAGRSAEHAAAAAAAHTLPLSSTTMVSAFLTVDKR
jgi:hypothetical protein